MQTTLSSMIDTFSLKSPEPTTTTTATSKPPTTKPFLPEDDDDGDLFSDLLLGSRGSPPPKLVTKTQEVSKPTPKSRGLFDEDVSDDDLFSISAPPKKEKAPPPAQKKLLTGAVPIFGGKDPLTGRSQLGVGKKDEKTRGTKKEWNGLFGKSIDPIKNLDVMRQK